MFELFLIITAFLGSLISGIIDLKTTEIPDEIPYLMMGIGILVHGIESYLAWSYLPILFSFIVGLSYLAFGFFMYYLGQWGGGDAKLLSGIGFLIPTLPHKYIPKLYFPFALSFLFNVFLIGAIYMIVYAIVLTFKEKKIWFAFLHDLKSNSRILLAIIVFIVFILFGFSFLMTKYFLEISFFEIIKMELSVFLVTIGLFLLWRFVKTVEEVGFKKRIPISQLREGDVLLESKIWEGLTKEQVKKIKKSWKKFVWIKEGVRFGLTFPLALLFTFLVGDGIILILNLL